MNWLGGLSTPAGKNYPPAIQSSASVHNRRGSDRHWVKVQRQATPLNSVLSKCGRIRPRNSNTTRDGTFPGQKNNMVHVEKFKRTDVDVAVVGAGVAGLYLAWRLLSEPAYKTKSIALFDAADRVGGRILSVSVADIPYVMELGAMRYLPDQILVRSLIEDRLQLEHSDFRFETKGYFLRGNVESTSLKRLSL
jgi:hypothetical protein